LLAGVLISALVLAATGAAFEALAEYHDRQAFPQRGRLWNVGGYRLNLDCSSPAAQGGPTVILESGAGEPGREWALVQPQIAEFTQVCSYDRAGYGWSDPGPQPRTSGRMAQELHSLLAAAGVSPPYILVGHSLGGLNVRLYAARYPEETAAVVLVDASHPDQESRGFKPVISPLAWVEPILLRLGISRALFMLDGAAKLPGPLHDELKCLMLQDKAIVANLDEVRSFSESAAEVRAAGNLGNKPLVVLTAEYSALRRPELRRVWLNELQPDLVRLSSNARQELIPSGHYIPLQQPQAVVEAVRQLWVQTYRTPSARLATSAR
jgi:pimeloyl-ACP methyl ester carboxylesterase